MNKDGDRIMMNDNENLSMLCDFYELTMGNGYYRNGFYKRNVYFDVFFRNVPDGGGFAIAAGLEQIVEYIQQLHFTDSDLEYLRGKGIFDDGFLDYLKHFKFHGDIYAVPEGTPVFPGEPLLTVRAPAIEAQLIETYLLLAINHQSLIATKANRIVRSAQGRTVLEFGSRRAQGVGGAVIGARAAYIGGVAGTACTLTDVLYGVPAGGTMAHSWVQMFDSEYEAFKTYCELYPDNATLLVDTYNTLKSGIPNAIRAFKEVLLPRGITNCAIRLDSGDISYLSKKARKMLDEAGLPNCKITASNSLDEYLIRDLMMQGAQVDTFGVGERLITSKSNPVFGGVYKLVAVEDEQGNIIPKIKISENTAKITNPHFKRLYRLYDRESGKAIADELTLRDEVIDETKPHVIFDQNATWKTKELTDFTVRELQVPIFQNGELVYNLPSLPDIKAYCRQQIHTLWDEVKRFENPHTYYVDLSKKLWDIKRGLLEAAK
jgi:nicotinate phosphoribosyltransferase